MTRMHFETLAAAMRKSKPSPQDEARLAQWEADVRAVAAACLASNARFQQPRFHAACGYGA